MLKLIVNCGPAEGYIGKCLASIRRQSLVDWQAFVTIDPCGDGTHPEAIAARADDARINITENETRQFSMLNLIQGVRRSKSEPEDIVVVLDGDDWFSNPEALRIIHETYRQSDCWMTYGSWVTDGGQMRGQWPAYPEDTSDFRNHEWLGTAVRTWKRWLWDLIDDQDFRDGQGNYFHVTEDQAVMLPMLEMCGSGKAKHIPDVLMVYNRSSPHAVAYTRRKEMLASSEYLRTRPPYSRLREKPRAALSVEVV